MKDTINDAKQNVKQIPDEVKQSGSDNKSNTSTDPKDKNLN